MDYLDRKEKKLLKTMQLKDIANITKNISNSIMLDALELEQEKRWPKLGNLDKKIDLDLIFPQNVLNFSEYQAKIQKLALLAEAGDTDGMQALLDNKSIIDKKNKLLQPIFRDVKSQIKHMTHTPEFELMREYLSMREQIVTSGEGAGDNTATARKLNKLRAYYGVLLAKRKKEINESLPLQLKTIKQRLDNIYELLSLWNRYTEVIYMPESEMNFILMMEKMDIRPQDVAYTTRLHDADVATRLNMLFGKDQELDETEAADADYETVNEGNTTDTTSGLDEDQIQSRHESFEFRKEHQEQYGKIASTELGRKIKSQQI